MAIDVGSYTVDEDAEVVSLGSTTDVVLSSG